MSNPITALLAAARRLRAAKADKSGTTAATVERLQAVAAIEEAVDAIPTTFEGVTALGLPLAEYNIELGNPPPEEGDEPTEPDGVFTVWNDLVDYTSLSEENAVLVALCLHAAIEAADAP